MNDQAEAFRLFSYKTLIGWLVSNLLSPSFSSVSTWLAPWEGRWQTLLPVVWSVGLLPEATEPVWPPPRGVGHHRSHVRCGEWVGGQPTPHSGLFCCVLLYHKMYHFNLKINLIIASTPHKGEEANLKKIILRNIISWQKSLITTSSLNIMIEIFKKRW